MLGGKRRYRVADATLVEPQSPQAEQLRYQQRQDAVDAADQQRIRADNLERTANAGKAHRRLGKHDHRPEAPERGDRGVEVDPHGHGEQHPIACLDARRLPAGGKSAGALGQRGEADRRATARDDGRMRATTPSGLEECGDQVHRSSRLPINA